MLGFVGVLVGLSLKEREERKSQQEAVQIWSEFFPCSLGEGILALKGGVDCWAIQAGIAGWVKAEARAVCPPGRNRTLLTPVYPAADIFTLATADIEMIARWLLRSQRSVVCSSLPLPFLEQQKRYLFGAPSSHSLNAPFDTIVWVWCQWHAVAAKDGESRGAKTRWKWSERVPVWQIVSNHSNLSNA